MTDPRSINSQPDADAEPAAEPAAEPTTALAVVGPLLTALERAELEDLAAGAKHYVEAALSANTRRAYASDWSHFSSWCATHHFTACPADPVTVHLYLQSEVKAGRRVSTIERRVASIGWYHLDAGFESPADHAIVRRQRRGMRRELGRPPKKKTAAILEQLRAMLPVAPTLHTVRDRAILLLGWAGAFRRSELAALDVTDCRAEGPKRLVITLRRSKTDQEGAGMTKVILRGEHPDTCPIRSLELWQKAGGITSGALFRRISRYGTTLDGRLSDRAIARVVQNGAKRAGLDPKLYGGHSLRSGFITEAYLQDVPEADIMEQSGHRSIAVTRQYRQVRDLRRRDAAGRVGL
jgi:site-specific recombinase XerD